MSNKENVTAVETFENLEQTGLLTKTANVSGWQINALDEYGERFVQYAKTTRRPILDLGVAYGFTSKCLLDAGATVIANELSEVMLQELEKTVTDGQKSRLKLMPGDMLKLEIEHGSLDGVWANRCLTLLRPEELRQMIRKFCSWLAPGGKVCITTSLAGTGTPYFAVARHCLPEYNRRKAARLEWPGFMAGEDMPEEWRKGQLLVDFYHLLDPEILHREVEQAGFQVEKCSDKPLEFANGTEGVGILAVKSA